MKRIVSLLMSITMLCAMAFPAFAEATPDIVIEQIDSADTVSDITVESDVTVVTPDTTVVAPDEADSIAVDVVEPAKEAATSSEIQVLSDEEAQLVLASGNVQTLEVLDTPVTDGEYIDLGEIDIYDVESSDIISQSFNASKLMDFTTYREVISNKVVNLEGTYVNVGSVPKKAYDVMAADLAEGVNGTIFKGAGGQGAMLQCATFANPGVSASSLAKYIAILAYYALDWDNSSMFYSNGSISYGMMESNGKITLAIRPTARHEMTDYDTRVDVKNKIDAKVNEIVTAANSVCKTNREKVTYFNKWLCDNNEYNDDAAAYGVQAYGSGYPWSAASGLLSGSDSSITSPVCEGYSRAMQTLCQAVNIPCILVTGDNHMWNNIMVDYAWYGNDTTWNDGEHNLTKYLLTTDLNNSSGHTVQGVAGVTFDYPMLGEKSKIADFVERLYTTALGRASEPAGKQSWFNYLIAGKATGAEAGKAFMLSEEFEKRNLTDDEFLNVVYQTYFGREPDEGGYNAWMNFLKNGYSREGVICSFAVSKEFQKICDDYGMERGTITSSQNRDKNPTLTSFVNRIYTKLLDRDAEEKGLNDWTGAILDGKFTVKQTAVLFVESKEFLEHDYSTEDYVTHLYRMFFDREPEKAGFDKWVKYIDDGKCTRTQAAEAFADGPEFAEIMKDAGV